MHEWLVSSLFLLGIWVVVFIAKPLIRKEMKGNVLGQFINDALWLN
jgi:hypothetical protein